jgi:HD-GYP domain-containing protein (c-di-GMP phosphodiesterase class II)
MRLHRPIYHGSELVLRGGQVLNGADIDYLRAKCRGVMVSVEDPVLDKLIEFDDDSGDYEVANSFQSQLIRTMSGIQSQYTTRLAPRSFDIGGIENAIIGVLGYLKSSSKFGHTLTHIGDSDDYITAHSVHAFYLSLVIGNSVRARATEARRRAPFMSRLNKPDEFDLAPLALAALLMDMGMAPIKHIYEQTETLTMEQIQLIRNHPIASAELLPDDLPPVTRLIIETHHENYDGSGYPYALKGDEIHVLARILRIADAYCAATSTHVYREACSPVRALWEMARGPFSQFYDPVLLKVFTSLVQPFPIGARVGLNSGYMGVVVRHGEAKPFLPEIVIAFDGGGERLPRDKMVGPIKLDQEESLRIRSFNGEDLSDMYDQDTRVSAATPEEFTSLYESVYTGCAMSQTR